MSVSDFVRLSLHAARTVDWRWRIKWNQLWPWLEPESSMNSAVDKANTGALVSELTICVLCVRVWKEFFRVQLSCCGQRHAKRTRRTLCDVGGHKCETSW